MSVATPQVTSTMMRLAYYILTIVASATLCSGIGLAQDSPVGSPKPADTSKPETARDPPASGPETARDSSKTQPETAASDRTNTPETARDSQTSGPETARDDPKSQPETAASDHTNTPETATDRPNSRGSRRSAAADVRSNSPQRL
jgi:hypothetical protein